MLKSPQGLYGDYHKQFKANFSALMSSQPYLSADRLRQRDFLGNLIFNYVSRLVHINFVRKVTGMILDLEQADFNLTIGDYELFKAKVSEAVKMLNTSGASNLNSSSNVVARKSLNMSQA